MHSRAWTWGLIALATYATAGLSAIAAIATLPLLYLFLPENDTASDPWLYMYLDPFVLAVAVPLAITGATIVLPFAIWALRGTDLDKSIPRVAKTTIICAALTGPGTVILAVPLTILVGAAAMLWVRSNPKYKLEGI